MSMKQVNLLHIFLIGPTLFYIGYNKDKSNNIAKYLISSFAILLPFIVRFPNLDKLDNWHNYINAFHWIFLIPFFVSISYIYILKKEEIHTLYTENIYPLLKYTGIIIILTHIYLLYKKLL